MMLNVYVPVRSRLYQWRVDIEISVLRFLATVIRAAQHEDWHAVLALCAAGWLTGLIAAVALLALLPY